MPSANPFVTARFCREECGPWGDDKIAMLLRAGHAVDVLPEPAIVHAAYVKHHDAECSHCGKIKNIVAGFGRLAWHRVTKGKPDAGTVRRSAICAECEHRTFLSVTEWAIGAVHKGDLPINHEPGDWDALWCSKCKCCIEAKIRVPDEKCPLDKWDELTGEQHAE